MKDFSEYTDLEEALITFDGKAYPKFGHILIMAGGAGSGKGFVRDNLVGLEGKVFDVDNLKRLAMKTKMIVKDVKKELGVDISKFDLKKPKDVSKLHEIIAFHLNLSDKKMTALYSSILTRPPERKPNIIFDVTLKDLSKLNKLTTLAKNMNYDPKKIHIVWVINDVEVSLKQNTERERIIDAEILINTHRGVSSTMYDIIKMGKNISRYMDGNIVFAFNKIGVDADVRRSGNKQTNTILQKGKEKKIPGEYINKANYFYVKLAGKAPLNYETIAKSIRSKIKAYVPRGVNWT